MWALLALLTASSGAVPPFQLLAMTFAVATIVGAAASARHGRLLAHLRQPWPVWALGVGGLFGYHAFYFLALRTAPAVEASLIAYLWLLLIVRSEEHTSELQSLMRISYAVFCSRKYSPTGHYIQPCQARIPQATSIAQ